MTDYLLVHGATEGAWAWGRVWGYLTAPEEHPPRLDRPRRIDRVYALDLPGHGANRTVPASQVGVEECVQALVQAVAAQRLRQPVLVGHSLGGALLLQAMGQFPQPPKRLVLLAGLVPGPQTSLLGLLPRRARAAFRVMSAVGLVSRQPMKLPGLVIRRCVCDGLPPMEVAQAVGRFGPLPVRLLKARFDLSDLKPPCPVTYVVLTRDSAVPPPLQRWMAQRIPGVEIVELDSCHEPMLHRPRELAQLLSRYA